MKYVILCLLALAANFTYAATDTWSGNVKVTEVRTGYKDGAVVFKVDQILPNPASCPTTTGATPSSILIAIEPDKADAASMLTLLLAAKMANVYVQVAVSGSACGAATYADTKDRRVAVQVALIK